MSVLDTPAQLPFVFPLVRTVPKGEPNAGTVVFASEARFLPSNKDISAANNDIRLAHHDVASHIRSLHPELLKDPVRLWPHRPRNATDRPSTSASQQTDGRSNDRDTSGRSGPSRESDSIGEADVKASFRGPSFGLAYAATALACSWRPSEILEKVAAAGDIWTTGGVSSSGALIAVGVSQFAPKLEAFLSSDSRGVLFIVSADDWHDYILAHDESVSGRVDEMGLDEFKERMRARCPAIRDKWLLYVGKEEVNSLFHTLFIPEAGLERSERLDLGVDDMVRLFLARVQLIGILLGASLLSTIYMMRLLMTGARMDETSIQLELEGLAAAVVLLSFGTLAWFRRWSKGLPRDVNEPILGIGADLLLVRSGGMPRAVPRHVLILLCATAVVVVCGGSIASFVAAAAACSSGGMIAWHLYRFLRLEFRLLGLVPFAIVSALLAFSVLWWSLPAAVLLLSVVLLPRARPYSVDHWTIIRRRLNRIMTILAFFAVWTAVGLLYLAVNTVSNGRLDALLSPDPLPLFSIPTAIRETLFAGNRIGYASFLVLIWGLVAYRRSRWLVRDASSVVGGMLQLQAYRPLPAGSRERRRGYLRRRSDA